MSLFTKELGTKEGFRIVFNAMSEDTAIEDVFSLNTEEDIKKSVEKALADIDKGDSVYFCAKVTAYFHDLPLCDTYLGCCIYETYESFLNTEENGYLLDMVDEVIAGAKERLKVIVETGKDFI